MPVPERELATVHAKRDGGRCLGTYRVDTMARALPILALAAFMTTLGALGICSTFVGHGVVHRFHDALTYGGAFCMMVGPFVGFAGMRQLLADDEYLAVFERGLLLHATERDAFLPWDDVSRVRWDGAAIVIEGREAAPVRLSRSFGGVGAEALTGRIDDVRRKASFDLL